MTGSVGFCKATVLFGFFSTMFAAGSLVSTCSVVPLEYFL